MSADSPTVVWFRRDLRLDDNPAWAAVAPASPTTALYVIDPALFDRAGSFRRDQLVAHLIALDGELTARGGRLRVEYGDPTHVVAEVAQEVGAAAVHANADATPYSHRRDTAAHRALASASPRPVPLRTWWGTMVHHPGAIQTRKGTLSQVFTPFWNTWAATSPAAWPDGPGPHSVMAEAGRGLPPAPATTWQSGGEHAALDRLEQWCTEVDAYPKLHDRPDLDGTSRLSADLRFGTVSPRRVMDAVGLGTPARLSFVRQLAWRDWFAHLLAERPSLVTNALKTDFDRIDWLDEPTDLDAWKHGRTGYPLVDAGMRQLLTTGWMHNRVRMVVASFLVKDLLIDWRQGEHWFRHQLVDGDVAQNVGNWQWAAGTGPDAAPYFRIFNPVTQSKKFDPDGDYIRRWVPELANLDRRSIHEPWTLGPLELAAAGITLGSDYPAPIVDHRAARDRTLLAYAEARATAAAEADAEGAP